MQRKLLKGFSITLGVFGLLILIIVIFPIASYWAKAKQNFPNLISPIFNEESEKQNISNLDYTRASNWFTGGVGSDSFDVSDVSFYTISIPALEIEKATVALGGEDLSKSLIQYPGTSLPGRLGNSVIFGHSVLPVFYDPKDYLAIFSTLPTLEKGNKIYIDYDGVLYTYVVENMFEVSPADIQILSQNVGSSNLSLVTCTPPGDPRKPKRLIVRAKMVPST